MNQSSSDQGICMAHCHRRLTSSLSGASGLPAFEQLQASDRDRPRIESWLLPHASEARDVGGFTVLAGADVTHAWARQCATIRCVVTGYFSYEGEVDPELLARFQHREAMVLLWPYVRAAVGEIGRMMDIELPPLPTLDVLEVLSGPAEEPEASANG